LRISDCGLTDFNPQSAIRNPQSEINLMSRRAIYTGSFDPITLGHLNVIERSSRLVDELIVGVGINIEKEALFTADERVALIRRVTDPLGNVVVKPFSGLAVRFVRECDARVIIRGVRSLSDMDSEFTMTLANRKLDPGIETVYLMADEEYSHVSSSLIKQITPLAGDEELARFVPRAIIPDLRARIQERGGSGAAPARGY
jgi:pantetheine-phosphate adenylyltransferase